jgi:hypothetical protein
MWRGWVEIEQGGRALPYHDEDPFVRAYYQERLAQEGAAFTMPPEVYEGPNDLTIAYSQSAPCGGPALPPACATSA